MSCFAITDGDRLHIEPSSAKKPDSEVYSATFTRLRLFGCLYLVTLIRLRIDATIASKWIEQSQSGFEKTYTEEKETRDDFDR